MSGAEGSRPKVLLIGVDGVRVDILERAYTPHIDSLIAHGAFSGRVQMRAPTGSGHGWSNMLTGVWADKHLVTTNDMTVNDYRSYPNFLARLEGINPNFNTLAVATWAPLVLSVSGGPMLDDPIDRRIGLGRDDVNVRWAAGALQHLDPDATFVHLLNTDRVGHETSTLDPEYERAIEIADQQVGTLLAAVTRRRTFAFENWLILIATDHGRKDDGSHGGDTEEELTIFVLASGPSVMRGTLDPAPEIVDVAVTALTHLGIEIRPEWNLDGRVFGLR